MWPHDGGTENKVDDKEEQPKQKDRNNHYAGRHSHFFWRGRNDFAHLRAHIAQKARKLGPLTQQAAAKLSHRSRLLPLCWPLLAFFECHFCRHVLASFFSNRKSVNSDRI